jgi:hypothetical protein
MSPLTITSVDITTQSVVVSWSAPSQTGGSAITGYYLQINQGYGTSFLSPGTFVTIGTTSYTYSGLILGATYEFIIAAVNTLYTTNSFPGDVINFSQPVSQIIAAVPSQVTTLS